MYQCWWNPFSDALVDYAIIAVIFQDHFGKRSPWN
jgi:hypothetical protein